MKTSKRLDYIKKNITSKKLIEAGYPVFVKSTPIKTGNARRHTLKNDQSITADYPYAKRLDQGYSKQSPNGMVSPAIKAMRDYIKKIIG